MVALFLALCISLGIGWFSSVAELKSQLEEIPKLRAQVATLTLERDQAQARVEGIERVVAGFEEVRRENAALKAELKSVKEELARAKEGNRIASFERDTLAGEVRNLDEQQKTATAWQKTILETIKDMKLEAEKREDLVRLGFKNALEVELLRAENKSLRALLAAKNRIIKDLSDGLADAGNMINDLRQAVERLNQSSVLLESRLADARQEALRAKVGRIGLAVGAAMLFMLLIGLILTYRGLRK